MHADSGLENKIYSQVAEEIAAGKFSPGPWAKALDKARGEKKLAESLYINFRFEEIMRERGLESSRQAGQRGKWRGELSDFLALPSPQLLALLAVLGIVILLGTCTGLLR